MIKWVYLYYRIFCSYENNEMLLCSNEERFQSFPIVQGRNVYTSSGSILVFVTTAKLLYMTGLTMRRLS